MKKRELVIGDVVQISPNHDPIFAACLMTVTEPKSWGAMGYVQIPGDEGGQAFYRCDFADMEYVGRATFVLESHAEQSRRSLPRDDLTEPEPHYGRRTPAKLDELIEKIRRA